MSIPMNKKLHNKQLKRRNKLFNFILHNSHYQIWIAGDYDIKEMDNEQLGSFKCWYRIIFDIQWQRMSTQEKPKQKGKKQITKEEQKKLNEAWKLKQEQKKKEKQMKEGAAGSKDEKKEKKKNKNKEQQQKKSQAQVKGQIVENKPEEVVVVSNYKKLSTIHDMICQKHERLIDNRSQQILLIQKAVQGLLSDNNIIIHLGNSKFTKNYQFVEIPNFTNHPESDFRCRYQDISCLLEDEVDKVICEAEVFFGNGSALVKKGYSNIVYIAELYKVPVVISCGSWSYSGCVPHNEDELQRLFGPDILQKYDWISSDSIDLVAMQFGAIHPSQITEHITQGYKSYGFQSISW